MRWSIASADAAAVQQLQRELGISATLARVLACRGFTDPEAAYQFLHPSLSQLHDPFRMAGMKDAVERIRRAIEGREKILIYGDYDVDGTMAVVLLLTALGRLGALVEVFIPDRFADGYGMRVPVVERAAAEGFRVVISVDTGIREHEVIARAQQLGIDCIVTDHHAPKETLPAACAILNPRRCDCLYPDKNLSGVGVAFKLAQALLGSAMTDAVLKSYLKIVAIGSIADVVPVVGENRVIARFGLEGLCTPKQAGLEALIRVAGLEGSPITTGSVGFQIAPRLNAAGRMEDARMVIDLFTTQDARRAQELAERLDGLNRERQRVEDAILSEITRRAEKLPELAKRHALVLAGEGWHPGVIGIVAQRVAERYYRPALIVGIDDGVGRGSGRSIPGFNLVKALAEVGDLFERFGGHAQAGGFTIRAEKLPELEERFESHARQTLSESDLERVLRVDAEVDPSEVDWPLYESVKRLEPFGTGNPAPVFVARGVNVEAPPRILKEKHLKLRLRFGKKTLDGLAWNRASAFSGTAPAQALDVAFSMDENAYQGFRTLQLVMKDWSGHKAD